MTDILKSAYIPRHFAKMHSCGNDFVLLHDEHRVLTRDGRAVLARTLCHRRMGIGADGLILLTAGDADHDITWWYGNSDGSAGDLCGNGVICAARFAVDRGLAPLHQRMRTPAGTVIADVDAASRHVTVSMPPATIGRTGLDVGAPGGTLADEVTVGVPHIVLIVEDADDVADFDAVCRPMRHHPALGAAGANVNMISPIDARTIRMRTYERGVEAETLACGTGAIASSIVGARHGVAHGPITVRTSSGLPLTVQWKDDGDHAVEIRLSSEAHTIATGELQPDAFRPISSRP